MTQIGHIENYEKFSVKEVTELFSNIGVQFLFRKKVRVWNPDIYDTVDAYHYYYSTYDGYNISPYRSQLERLFGSFNAPGSHAISDETDPRVLNVVKFMVANKIKTVEEKQSKKDPSTYRYYHSGKKVFEQKMW